MKDFTKKVLALVERQADQAKRLIDAANGAIETFDLAAEIAYLKERKETILAKGRELMNEVNEFYDSIKTYMSDFVLTIPFDGKKGEEVSMDIVDGTAVITVIFESEDESYRRSKRETIPQGFDIDSAELVIDEEKGTASIVIPKLKADEVTDEGGEEVGEEVPNEATDEGGEDAIDEVTDDAMDMEAEADAPSEAGMDMEAEERKEWADEAPISDEERVLDAFEKI